MNKETYTDIWKNLSSKNVNHLTEDKNNLTYLSWGNAWGLLMEEYPEATYMFYENTVEADGSLTVNCSVTIDGACRTMWLPVMDFRNKALLTPTSKDVSDSKMRCLVKCLAMFGLGHYIYAGLNAPRSTSPVEGGTAPQVLESLSTGEPFVSSSVDVVPCGANKGKSYDEVYGSSLEQIEKHISYFAPRTSKTPEQEEHLSNLKQYRLSVATARISNGVLA